MTSKSKIAGTLAAAHEVVNPPGCMGARPEPLDPKDYEIMCLKLRNEQLHRRIAVLEQQLKEAAQDPWAAGEGEV